MSSAPAPSTWAPKLQHEIFPDCKNASQVEAMLNEADNGTSKMNAIKAAFNLRMPNNISETSPIRLVVPGVMGSTLASPSKEEWITWDSRTSVWEAAGLQPLLVRHPGAFNGWFVQPTNGLVELRAINLLRLSLLMGVESIDPYSEFMETTKSLPWPYDWREDLRVVACRLYVCLSQTNPKARFSITTHSMGGLVVCYMLGRFPDIAARIDKIAFVAPPFRGAVFPLQMLECGLMGNALDRTTNPARLRQLAVDFPGCLQLCVAPPLAWTSGQSYLAKLIGDSGGSIDSLPYPVRTNTQGVGNNVNRSSQDLPWVDHFSTFLFKDQSVSNRIRSACAHFHLDCEIIRQSMADESFPLKDRIAVISGYDAQTMIAATEIDGPNGFPRYVFGRSDGLASNQGKDGYWNGDGSVLLQSTIIQSNYVAHFPVIQTVNQDVDTSGVMSFWNNRNRHADFHQSILKLKHVQHIVDAFFTNGTRAVKPEWYTSLNKVANRIDWAHESLILSPKEFNPNAPSVVPMFMSIRKEVFNQSPICERYNHLTMVEDHLHLGLLRRSLLPAFNYTRPSDGVAFTCLVTKLYDLVLAPVHGQESASSRKENLTHFEILTGDSEAKYANHPYNDLMRVLHQVCFPYRTLDEYLRVYPEAGPSLHNQLSTALMLDASTARRTTDLSNDEFVGLIAEQVRFVHGLRHNTFATEEDDTAPLTTAPIATVAATSSSSNVNPGPSSLQGVAAGTTAASSTIPSKVNDAAVSEKNNAAAPVAVIQKPDSMSKDVKPGLQQENEAAGTNWSDESRTSAHCGR